MEGEQFSLCWNNFHSNLSSGFHTLYKEEDLVDVTLAAEGKYIKAHKTVLSVCSPYFKELFRVNPCKHPIVILQNVNYTALCSLLQFMYQGQVSVSQEEIPTFMKVAETLKVKGLTDNGSSKLDTNGMNSFPDQKNVMKKPIRPVKKPIRSIQQHRLQSSPVPRAVKSPLPPSVTPPSKKLHLDEQSMSSQQQLPQLTRKPEHMERLIEPKIEPMDQPDEDDSTQQSFDDEHFDMNSMLSQTLESGENSFEYGWAPENVKQPDTSSPGVGRLMFLRSGKGQFVLVCKGHMYFLDNAKDERYTWLCVKKNKHNCEGCIVTMEGPILITEIIHNHPPLHDIIKRLQMPSSTPLNLSKKKE